MYVLQPNTWSLTWGGAIEPGENPKAAACEEANEEMEVDINQASLKPVFVYKKDAFKYHSFLYVCKKEFKPILNWETETYKWLSLDKLPDPIHFGTTEILDDTNAYSALKNI